MEQQKLVAFDLDGTLTKSKQSMSLKMAQKLKDLAKYCYIAIVSGASEAQFRQQVIPTLELLSFPMQKLFLVTTNGGRILHHVGEDWTELMPFFMMTEDDEKRIIRAVVRIFDKEEWSGDIMATRTEQIECRGSQVTFSALGQNAPLDLKKDFDPDLSKRRPFRDRIAEALPEFDVKIGGTTSIDIVLKGVSKVSGLQQIMDFMSIPRDEVLYVGDALYEGGNDRCVKDAGFRCVEVINPWETESVINRLLYPYLYVQPEGEDECPSIWRLRRYCKEHIWKYPGGTTPAKYCLACREPNPNYGTK